MGVECRVKGSFYHFIRTKLGTPPITTSHLHLSTSPFTLFLILMAYSHSISLTVSFPSFATEALLLPFPSLIHINESDNNLRFSH